MTEKEWQDRYEVALVDKTLAEIKKEDNRE